MTRPRVRSALRALAVAPALLLAAALASPLAAQSAGDDAAARRLATFDAAWRIIDTTHFDPTFNGVDWRAVREELRPRAAAAASDAELRAVIRDMLGRLHESHFALLSGDAADGAAPEGVVDTSGEVGLDVRVLDEGVTVASVRPGGPAGEAGVEPGWILRAVDATPTAPIVERMRAAADPRAAGLEAWRAVTTRLRGPQGLIARLELVDGGGAVVRREVRRAPEPGRTVKVGNLPAVVVRVADRWVDGPAGTRAGLIRFNVWMPPVDAPFGAAVDRFRAADGIVIDLRGNPGGMAAMLMGISGYFLDTPRALGTMRTRESELRFVANPRRVNAAGERVTPFAGPVAILVDGLTGSASECFAAGMQSIGRARIFGERSMGQALPALFDRLPDGDVLIHAYGDFETAAGTPVEGRGIIPDERVALTRRDLLAGRDAPLEAALAWIARARR